MKQMTTLLIAISAFAAVQAQTPRDEARKVVLGGKTAPQTTSTRYPAGTYPSGSRQEEINEVNKNYDAKIQAVNRSPLSQSQKDKMIRQLEEERARKIREINDRYGTDNTGRTDNGRTDNRNGEYKKYKTKGNNGKHLGWEKGKGNPHKNGGKVKYKNKD